MNNKNYIEPEFKVVKANCDDILTASGGEDFNMRGDQYAFSYFKNKNWTIEL